MNTNSCQILVQNPFSGGKTLMHSIRIPKGTFVALLLGLLWAPNALARGTYTAASCNQTDVNAVINGPTHTAVDGDVINIPAGSCTWASAVTAPSSIGISIIGAGIGNTVLTDNNTSGPMFSFAPTYGNSLTHISGMTLQPYTGATLTNVPLWISGTCTSSGCPNLRVDHIYATSAWANAGGPNEAIILENNMFGVVDHNTVGDTGVTTGSNSITFIDGANSAWGGVGGYGDNSFAQADTFGTAQALYVEDNTFVHASANQNDVGLNGFGGFRIVARFNTVTYDIGSTFVAFHGTDWTGRQRGGRQAEVYGNSQSCQSGGSCGGNLGINSSDAITFGNTLTAPNGWYNNYAYIGEGRAWTKSEWGNCNGTGVYDINDGAVTSYTGTISSATTNTLTVSGSPWTAGVYNYSSTSPGSKYYIAYDKTSGELGGIASNTANRLTFSWKLSNIAGNTFSGNSFTNGDTFAILGSTLYAAGTETGAGGDPTLTDSSKSWTTNQWVRPGDAYSVIDVTTGNTYQIGSNTSNTLTYKTSPSPYWSWTTGDAYAILAVSKCLDQPGTYGGTYLSGTVPSPIPSTPQTVSPIYEFDDSGLGSGDHIYSYSLNLVENTNYFQQKSSFNGSSGTGFGTWASRPATCRTGVGYWATDQGNWNDSNNGFGQGELFVCTSTNTWTSYYTPYVYPHPLAIDPPHNLQAIPN
jgi:hypothetical protein